jgi:DNA-binding MltR family transcriptional regulator
MSGSAEEFVTKQQKEVTAFRKALLSESDRGCGLFAAAYLDSSLSDLLYASLVANKKIAADLFEATAPLATFSSRIKMAYYLGLISEPCRRDLNIIRAIRNDFAHKLDIDSFEVQSVQNRCRALAYSYHEHHEAPKAHFVSAVMGILAQIHSATLTATQHQESQAMCRRQRTRRRIGRY